MAEEITYIPYGLDEISQLDLMASLANGIESYLGSKRWARKDKYRLAWLDAYQDIMNKGLRGASNDTGIWKISYNGDEEFDSKSNAEKEMYLDAAYYIQLQMSRMTPRKKEKEKKKEPLTPFDFYTNFNKHLLKGYGNDEEIFADPELGWDSLDVRGENGLRKTDKRKAAMIKALKEYSDNLEENKYNFEGTQFADLKDARTKILAAIDALKTPEESDDLPAFSALGLKYRSYFSNGGNDPSTHINEATGKPYTWSEWNELEKANAEAKAKADAEAAKKKLTQLLANLYKRFRFHTGTGASAEQLSKYKDVLGQLNGYGTGQSLTQELKNELVGAFQIAAQNGQLIDLSKEELLRFGKGYSNTPGRLKKIDGLNGFYWDTIGNRVILPFMDKTSPQTFLDIINANSPEAKQQLYLNQEGAEYAELGAIAADIASIIDPEPITAMGFSLGAAGARNYAKLQLPGKWGWRDYGSQALDYLTSVVGAVPVVGDAVLAGKVIKHLRRFGRFGAWSDIVSSTPGLKDIWDKKIMGDEKMTIQDWRTVGTALRGLISHGRMSQSNLAARKVMELRGISVDPDNVKGIKANVNKWLQKTGSTRTTPTETVTTKSSIKIKDENGKVVELPITEKVKQDLEKSFKGKSNAEKLKIVLENADIKKAAEGKIDLSKATGLDAAKDARNLQGVRRFTGTNRGIFGRLTTTSASERGTDNFENYLKNRGVWSKIALGSNPYLRRIDRLLNLNSNQIISQSQETTPDRTKVKGYLENLNTKTTAKPSIKPSPKTTPPTNQSKENNDIITPPQTNNLKGLPSTVKKGELSNVGSRPNSNYSVRQNQLELNNFIDSYGLNSKRGNRPAAGGYNPNRKIKDGVYKEGDIIFDKRNGKITVTIGNLKQEFTNLAHAKRYLVESINKSEIKKNDISKTAEILRGLKRKGILKLGGQINSLDKVIEDFLKNSNI